MKKKRIEIPNSIVAKVLFEHDHTCCKCNEQGKHVQIHHVDGDPSNNCIENLAVLCIEHHQDTLVRGGFGRKFLPPEVIEYRNNWKDRVALRRKRADEIAAFKMASIHAPPTTSEEAIARMVPEEQALVEYVKALPAVLNDAVDQARPAWESGTTIDMIQAYGDVIEILRQVWNHLATWFPSNHFGDPPDQFIEKIIVDRYRWHRTLAEPDGAGTGGTIVGIIASNKTMDELIKVVEDTVEALLGPSVKFSFLSEWKENWRSASEH